MKLIGNGISLSPMWSPPAWVAWIEIKVAQERVKQGDVATRMGGVD